MKPRPERGVGQGTFSTPLAGGFRSVLGSTPFFISGTTAMVQPVEKPAIDPLESLPPLPLDDRHWQAIFTSLRLSPQQARIVELILRSAGTRQIAAALSISEPTVKTYLQRVFARLGVRDRVGLAMRVLAVSHEVTDIGDCRTKG